ncbi:ribosomal L1 domain-containing protein 1 isoform X2 [Nelusetta ayraudi]|uniref:ribosomal L1 domain-containing protein 1 isoform X2 n=1 Tax=Nelusetta ayraudi TaxID=303726 RepID=UPI003F70FB2F
MAEATGIQLDGAQVKMAVQALQAFLKTTSASKSLLLDDSQPISLLFTLWRIPKKAQTIRIPLPNAHRTDTDEVCLFVRDEPKMTSEQTQRFYKKMLEENGVKSVTEIIPYNVLKKEYKPFEAKRRLLNNFNVFISDESIRRLLPSHLGKHFYERKKVPLCVNMKSKNVAREIQKVVQGSNLKVTNKGSCCMARVGHSAMTAEELTENIEAAIKVVAAKIRMKEPVIKIIHVKSQSSVALPIYTANLSHLKLLKKAEKEAKTTQEEAKAAKRKTGEKEDASQTESSGQGEKKAEEGEEEDEEEIPQLVPVATPSKKPRLQVSTIKKKQLEKVRKAAGARPRKHAHANRPRRAGQTNSKGKRKAPKVK